ncbi:orotidine-5'-phosphate decarboxylase [Candidatus Sumerlaeota bacterium]|nr:orotidine-5'-phosphate decarboxylase [Candidatus Sumerlaeota bacterium]
MDFTHRLLAAQELNGSLLCVGLDPDLTKLPEGFEPRPRDVLAFNRAIIEVTRDLVCAYKPNLAFYESLGRKGWKTLRRTIDLIPEQIPVILDAKRGDIGNTAALYAKALFEELDADAATVNPLMGTDSLEPFLEHPGRGVFVLCLTSNPGSREFQLSNSLHLQIAKAVREKWRRKNSNVGLVVGATHPKELRDIRAICPDQIILIPGVGAQGGALEETIRAGVSHVGPQMIINASRSIIHAGKGKDFAKAARAAAKSLRQEILTCLRQTKSSKRSTPSSKKS